MAMELRRMQYASIGRFVSVVMTSSCGGGVISEAMR